MKQLLFRIFTFLFAIGSISTFAKSISPSAKDYPIKEWNISGIVTSEKDNMYGYFFQLQKEGTKYKANAVVIDAETNAPVFIGESDSIIEKDAHTNDYHIGKAFLRFNPISDSWVFGFTPKDGRGFNFRVDMLSATHAAKQPLGNGTQLSVILSGNVNGHILLGDKTKEQFVTAKSAWYRHIIQSRKPVKIVFGSLCRFVDGSSFYTASLGKKDAVNATISGWFDSKNNAVDMSQFAQIGKDEDGSWRINVPTPNKQLKISRFIKKEGLVIGFTDNKPQGFCLLAHQISSSISS